MVSLRFNGGRIPSEEHTTCVEVEVVVIVDASVLMTVVVIGNAVTLEPN